MKYIIYDQSLQVNWKNNASHLREWKTAPVCHLCSWRSPREVGIVHEGQTWAAQGAIMALMFQPSMNHGITIGKPWENGGFSWDCVGFTIWFHQTWLAGKFPNEWRFL